MNVGVDLDGTLIETNPRHAAVLKHASEKVGVPLPAGFAKKYLARKRDGISTEAFLVEQDCRSAKKIAQLWRESIENEEFLTLDKVFPDVYAALAKGVCSGVQFYLVTARQYPERAIAQVRTLGLDRLLKGTFVAAHPSPFTPKRTKADLTRDLVLDCVIGDSEMDHEWAVELSARFLPVSCGIRSGSFWKASGLQSFETFSEALSELISPTGKDSNTVEK